MTMKFLIVNTDYRDFLEWLYTSNPGREEGKYAEQMRVRQESLFGVADFYSSNLIKLGHEAHDIYANNEFMQKAWAREHHVPAEGTPPRWQKAESMIKYIRRGQAYMPLGYFKEFFRPLLRWTDRKQTWIYEILSAQIKHFQPDVVLNQDMDFIDTAFWRQIKPEVRVLVGQNAALCPSGGKNFNCYDFVISSFPPTIDFFRKRGASAELNKLAFEPAVLSRLENKKKVFDVTFIGSLFDCHRSRVDWLENLCNRFPGLKIWGPGIKNISSRSPIRKRYMGQAWGLEMYQIIRDSRITLNHHGDVPPYANNMRLYEATGVGALLLTDWKENLPEMFIPGREVVAYRTPEECAELIQYYLEHDEERESIARAGQARTLREHTYAQRMRELVDLVRRYL